MQNEEVVTLAEIIGTAVGRGKRDADFGDVGALGAATLELPDTALTVTAGAVWNERRLIAEAMWRAKYGRDALAAREAAILLCMYLARHPLFSGYAASALAEIMPGRAPRCTLFWFAALMIAEWINDRCPACGGTGLKGVAPENAARNVERYRRCDACHGHPGRATFHDEVRGLAIEVPAAIYRRYWAKRLNLVKSMLVEIDRGIISKLKNQKAFASKKK